MNHSTQFINGERIMVRTRRCGKTGMDFLALCLGRTTMQGTKSAVTATVNAKSNARKLILALVLPDLFLRG